MVQGFGWETKLYGPPTASPQEKRWPSGKRFLQLLAVTNTRATDTPMPLSLQSKLGGPSGRGSVLTGSRLSLRETDWHAASWYLPTACGERSCWGGQPERHSDIHWSRNSNTVPSHVRPAAPGVGPPCTPMPDDCLLSYTPQGAAPPPSEPALNPICV